MKKATQLQTKLHNTRLILKTIYDLGEVSRAEVARLTRLTRTTVSELVAELIAAGLVAERGQGQSAGGKPPILIGVDANARYLIGIDLASREFKGAVVNLRGEISHRLHVPTDDLRGPAALERVYDLVDGLVAMADRPILGIGIGAPGLVDARRGVIVHSVNLGWEDLPLQDLLQTRTDLPIYLANDCQAAALAEVTFGESKGQPNLVLIRVGRGVGAGVILNQQLYYGDGGYGAGEIGHVRMVEDGEPCACGHDGCLETLVSSRAIVKQVRAIASDHDHSVLYRFVTAPDEIDLAVVARALAVDESDGYVAAIEAVVDRAGACLGQAIANLVTALGIRRIVLGGSVPTTLGPRLLEAIRRQVSRCALAALADETTIGLSTLGLDLVLLGAAALVLANELGIA